MCYTEQEPWLRYLWWRHRMETFSALLAICARNSPVPGEFPTQRPVTRSFDVFFNLRLKKRLSKQSSSWWFETLLRPLWCHHNVLWMTDNLSFRWINCFPLIPKVYKKEAHFYTHTIFIYVYLSNNFSCSMYFALQYCIDMNQVLESISIKLCVANHVYLGFG